MHQNIEARSNAAHFTHDRGMHCLFPICLNAFCIFNHRTDYEVSKASKKHFAFFRTHNFIILPFLYIKAQSSIFPYKKIHKLLQKTNVEKAHNKENIFKTTYNVR